LGKVSPVPWGVRSVIFASSANTAPGQDSPTLLCETMQPLTLTLRATMCSLMGTCRHGQLWCCIRGPSLSTGARRPFATALAAHEACFLCPENTPCEADQAVGGFPSVGHGTLLTDLRLNLFSNYTTKRFDMVAFRAGGLVQSQVQQPSKPKGSLAAKQSLTSQRTGVLSRISSFTTPQLHQFVSCGHLLLSLPHFSDVWFTAGNNGLPL
jgi:hypothetical protein